MSDQTKYRLTMTGDGFDPEFVIFKMLRDVEAASSQFDARGGTAGNGYDWRTIEEDMRAFSKTQPGILFEIVEYGTYDSESFEWRHYFRNGLHARIEPVVTVTWPTFDEGMLS